MKALETEFSTNIKKYETLSLALEAPTAGPTTGPAAALAVAPAAALATAPADIGLWYYNYVLKFPFLTTLVRPL